MLYLKCKTMKNKRVNEQVLLKVEELEQRIAPSAMVPTNPAGNHPQSEASLNGQAVDAANPAGHFPPGQNKGG
jgi:hypothetical protein